MKKRLANIHPDHQNPTVYFKLSDNEYETVTITAQRFSKGQGLGPRARFTVFTEPSIDRPQGLKISFNAEPLQLLKAFVDLVKTVSEKHFENPIHEEWYKRLENL